VCIGNELKRNVIYLLVPGEEIETIKQKQDRIIDLLENSELKRNGSDKLSTPYITAREFMQLVRIGRWKFNQLINESKIKTIKKKRKIYLPAGEVERYFKDNT
jgi:hypothetical protein